MNSQLIHNSMGTGDGQRESLSLSRNDFCRIVDECEFPVEFAQSILTNNGSMARFTTYESVNGKEVPSALCKWIFDSNSKFGLTKAQP